ncbi:uncharacterized protein CANTADRAFT_25090 [Suhomyces tanzawaensis NRRL Y-17324]|uniref:Elongator complex protein 5 n=1 Tax=Suhomyces tanzawaensis NRRL Y-17324 TaxID=984487 RepID=A0A1E4SM92_9ASCO|nr:uncharacterized protein CANTADRAFT_25090 [Suhomyces tanzawaensis NRRL Y-17324]ODV80631.1 hypothetical protein CANTADRAFT_25090 [Suhomyces tanzawaensis NRRL Y-17324]
MSVQNATVLVSRLVSLKEASPFVLVLDSLQQSSYYLFQEFVHRCSNNPIIYLSYETTNRPSYATAFVDCAGLLPREVVAAVHKEAKSVAGGQTKTLVLIDSLNYIANEELTQFVSSLIQPSLTVVASYHTNSPQLASTIANYPGPVSLLTYIASSIFEVEPLTHQRIDDELLEAKIERLEFPIRAGLNDTRSKVTLTNRRKSGRSLIYTFTFDASKHEFEPFKVTEDTIGPEDESLLKDLTTFNLTTNSKQRLAREQVELPFMEAQEALGSAGGAIVYEFEKDDDYDEEDPYEDPF